MKRLLQPNPNENADCTCIDKSIVFGVCFPGNCMAEILAVKQRNSDFTVAKATLHKLSDLWSIIVILFTFLCLSQVCSAQTARVYRSGTLVSTFPTVREAFQASIMGDSILLSAHTFNEYDIQMPGGRVLQGTMTATDTSIIDAKGLGRCGTSHSAGSTDAPLIIRDVIFTGGKFYRGAGINISDDLILRGRTTIRNCHATKYGGAVDWATLYDHARLTNNSADSAGGAGTILVLFDSAEVSYNTARRGGAVGYFSGGQIFSYSPGVRIMFNKATEKGGAVYGNGRFESGQVLFNEAPQGAAFYILNTYGFIPVTNSYLYNPRPDGTRSNEIYLSNGTLDITGTWFGKSDTIGMINRFASMGHIMGYYAKANWSVNRGKALVKNDTLFPIGAAFTYSDGTALPDRSCPWLIGKFSSSAGTMLHPNPTVSLKDTMYSLYRTFTSGGSKVVDFTCIVDGDTFRASPLVWGRDTSKLDIDNAALEQVLIYPNPANDVINIAGAAIGSTIIMTDVTGRIVIEQKATGNSHSIPVNHLTNGTYLLRIRTKEGREGSAKVMIE